MENLHVKIIPTFATVVGIEKDYSRDAFIGSKVGQMRLPKLQEHIALLEGLKKVKSPLKNTADLIILYTAVIENMNYLVTDNIDDFKRDLELFS
jgi:hypothetical protein